MSIGILGQVQETRGLVFVDSSSVLVGSSLGASDIGMGVR